MEILQQTVHKEQFINRTNPAQRIRQIEVEILDTSQILTKTRLKITVSNKTRWPNIIQRIAILLHSVPLHNIRVSRITQIISE